MTSRLPSRRLVVTVAVLLAPGACRRPPVDWGTTDVVVAAGGTQVSVSASGQPVFDPEPTPPTAPDQPRPCPGSVRYARDDSGRWYSVWWAARTDSSAGLWAARSDDGGTTWHPASIVDSTDAGVTGCRRAPPSVAASGDYVHVAYSMRAREGPGVFFAHSMDRGGLFHSPVAVAYGDRLGRTAVAAQGDRVVVAYEDPNGEPPHVALAISATTGHIFERRVVVSGANGEATSPQVALRGDVVVISWTERAGPDSTARAARLVRTGTIQ